jgi:hypothetical protein
MFHNRFCKNLPADRIQINFSEKHNFRIYFADVLSIFLSVEFGMIYMHAFYASTILWLGTQEPYHVPCHINVNVYWRRGWKYKRTPISAVSVIRDLPRPENKLEN